MKSVKTAVLAAILVLPVAALAASGKDIAAAKAAVSPVVAAVPAGAPGQSPVAYDCCWVYYVGSWMCVPC